MDHHPADLPIPHLRAVGISPGLLFQDIAASTLAPDLRDLRPDGSGLRQLTDVPADKTAGSPAWSPDGRRIVFSDNCCLPFSNVWVMQANGRGQRRLTNLREPEQVFFGSYSPDGRRLAEYAELGPTPDALTSGIYTMDAGGGPLVPVFTLDQPDVILFDWGTAP